LASMKLRVYEIAKELGVSSREVLWALNQLGVEVKNHMSTVDPAQVKDIRRKLRIFADEQEEREALAQEEEEKRKKALEKKAHKKAEQREEKAKTRTKAEQPKRKPPTKDRATTRRRQDRKQVSEEARKSVLIDGPITVRGLAEKLEVSPTEVIKKLMALGVMAAVQQEVDPDTAALVAADWGYEVKQELSEEAQWESEVLGQQETTPDKQQPRWPVVTVMGHVDHGKTSLLDAIRETEVAAREVGGITQHIGASTVSVDGKKIVFLDTPGHEAFTAMRARGAQVTDIAVLVVAADDGVMPQTIEAINHAKAAGVPILVAVNKIDKPEARPDMVKQQLSEHGLLPEDWGGDTIFVNVSAVTREGIDELLEMLLLLAEMQELKANPDEPARGTVIEARLDKGRGPVGTVIIKSGTLRVGDAFVSGTSYGRVRAMLNDKGQRLKEAPPSTAVEILGFSDVPIAGDEFVVVKDEKVARQVAEQRGVRRRDAELQASRRARLDDMFRRFQEGQGKELRIIIKADTHGTTEAVAQALKRIESREVTLEIIHTGVGAITESDVMLAAASEAVVIGFNVRPDAGGRRAAESEGVDVRTYRVIYEAIEDVKKALEGMLEPEYVEQVIGRAEVRATFKVPKAGVVAGCYVIEGRVTSRSKVRVVRDGVVVHEGSIASLKRFKDDVREVTQGFECGIGIEKFNDVKEGDILEFFLIQQVNRAG